MSPPNSSVSAFVSGLAPAVRPLFLRLSLHLRLLVHHFRRLDRSRCRLHVVGHAGGANGPGRHCRRLYSRHLRDHPDPAGRASLRPGVCRLRRHLHCALHPVGACGGRLAAGPLCSAGGSHRPAQRGPHHLGETLVLDAVRRLAVRDELLYSPAGNSRVSPGCPAPEQSGPMPPGWAELAFPYPARGRSPRFLHSGRAARLFPGWCTPGPPAATLPARVR
jgi:hypothetical protein